MRPRELGLRLQSFGCIGCIGCIGCVSGGWDWEKPVRGEEGRQVVAAVPDHRNRVGLEKLERARDIEDGFGACAARKAGVRGRGRG